jgi:hypothetical protein
MVEKLTFMGLATDIKTLIVQHVSKRYYLNKAGAYHWALSHAVDTSLQLSHR